MKYEIIYKHEVIWEGEAYDEWRALEFAGIEVIMHDDFGMNKEVKSDGKM